MEDMPKLKPDLKKTYRVVVSVTLELLVDATSESEARELACKMLSFDVGHNLRITGAIAARVSDGGPQTEEEGGAQC